MKHFPNSVHIRAATLREPTTYKKKKTVVRKICVKELNQHCKQSQLDSKRNVSNA